MDLETALLNQQSYRAAFAAAFWDDPRESAAYRHVASRSRGSARASLTISTDEGYRILSVESGLEYNWALVIDGLMRPKYMVEQPRAITFLDTNGFERQHTFDFFVITAESKRIYIQIKPLAYVERQFWDSTMALIASQMNPDQADEVLILTDVDLHPDAIANARILRYVRRCPPLAAEDAILDLLSRAGSPMTIGALVTASGLDGAAFVAALRHIDRGLLVVLNEGRITYASHVSLASGNSMNAEGLN